ncbi:hypothetical protein ENBRE01_0720 [Enteropsectra breve]|nr:hypothetical protein ENBRE01_0720 [Enteropsectra breve]
MENFYVSNENRFQLYTGPGIVDKDVLIYGNTLVADRPVRKMISAGSDELNSSSKLNMELDFDTEILRSSERVILMISDENDVYHFDRYTEDFEYLGQAQDPIRDVLLTDVAVYILTTQELMHFDSFCKLISSVCINNIIEVVNQDNLCIFYQKSVKKDLKFKIMTLNDSIAVIHNYIYIFNSKLEFIQKLPQDIHDATFMKKYNKFACIKGDQIVFIEPNGLEHGDPLPTPGFYSNIIEQLYIGDESLLVLADGESIRGYYMKNSYWFKKFEIPGEFHSVYDESICIKEYNYYTISISDETIDMVIRLTYKENFERINIVNRLLINRRINPFYIIDGNKLRCTNPQQSQIAPPFFYKEIELENNIKSVFYKDNLLFIYVDDRIDYGYGIINNQDDTNSKMDSFNEKQTCLVEDKTKALYVYEVNNGNFILIKKRELTKYLTKCEEIIDGDRDSIVLRFNTVIRRISLDDKPTDKDVLRTTTHEIGSSVINASMIQGDLALLHINGMFIYRSKYYNIFNNIDRLVQKVMGYVSVKYIIKSNTIKIFILANKKLVRIDVENSAGSYEIPKNNVNVCEVKTVNLSSVIANDVVSFICYKNYAIYNNKNFIFIYKDSKIVSKLHADGISILLMVNNKNIVIQRNSGSLESIAVEEFSI